MKFECTICDYKIQNYEIGGNSKKDRLLNHYEENHPEKKATTCITCGNRSSWITKMKGNVLLAFRYCPDCVGEKNEDDSKEVFSDIVRLGEWYDE